jgi:hypothetical protein
LPCAHRVDDRPEHVGELVEAVLTALVCQVAADDHGRHASEKTIFHEALQRLAQHVLLGSPVTAGDQAPVVVQVLVVRRRPEVQV